MGFRSDGRILAHVLYYVVAQGVVASPCDAALELRLVYSCTLGEQSATTCGTIAVYSHAICAGLVKRSAVRHALYDDALSVRLRYVYVVDDAGSGVEVVERLLQSEELVA